jgi:hypothetical protein
MTQKAGFKFAFLRLDADFWIPSAGSPAIKASLDTL